MKTTVEHIEYELDHYEVIFDNGEKHIFGNEDDARWYAECNKNRHPRFLKVMYGVLV